MRQQHILVQELDELIWMMKDFAHYWLEKLGKYCKLQIDNTKILQLCQKYFRHKGKHERLC